MNLPTVRSQDRLEQNVSVIGSITRPQAFSAAAGFQARTLAGQQFTEWSTSLGDDVRPSLNPDVTEFRRDRNTAGAVPAARHRSECDCRAALDVRDPSARSVRTSRPSTGPTT